MNLRKAVSLFLAAASLTALTACGGGGETSSAPDSSSASPQGGEQEGSASKAFVVKSEYRKNEMIVAEVDATSAEYGADPTGQKDSTGAIQAALNYCAYTLRGGTVYLPAGNYRVEGRIILRSGTTLVGDYVDPDKVQGTDYGTMLWVYTDKRFDDKLPVFQCEGSSCVDGVTIYYPEQDAKNPKDYYYTFDCKETGVDARTVRNVTILGGYCGFCSPLKVSTGMVTFENIKGTLLKQFMYIYSDADISIYHDLYCSPTYWAKMDASFHPASEASIRSAMKKLGGEGIRVQNIDRSNFRNVLLDGFSYGFYSEAPDRTAWCGNIYNATVKNADYGVYAEGVSAPYGINFANSSLSGGKYAVYNKITNAEGKQTYGAVNLYNSKVSGKTEGTVVSLKGDAVSVADNGNTPALPLPATDKLFNVGGYGADPEGKTDSTAAIQKALDDAKAAGGGIVYLPGGKYRCDGTLTVPKGTQLLGAMRDSSTKPSAGTVIFVYQKSKEFITLAGESAGVRGLYFAYPENSFSEDNYRQKPEQYPYTVKGTAKKNYCVHCTMVASANAVSMENADDFIVYRLLGSIWYNGVSAKNCKNGFIGGVHTNVTYTYACLELGREQFGAWMKNTAKKVDGNDLAASYVMIDLSLRDMLTLFKFENSTLTMVEDFHYGAKNFAEVKNSEVLAVSCEASRLNERGYVFSMQDSKVRGVNMICYDTNAELFPREGNCSLYLGNMDRANKTNFIQQ